MPHARWSTTRMAVALRTVAPHLARARLDFPVSSAVNTLLRIVFDHGPEEVRKERGARRLRNRVLSCMDSNGHDLLPPEHRAFCARSSRAVLRVHH